ncbi:co-chaperone GroES [Photobacterium atrarenae]|uniref:10 kDa chaperonin n=1 Tax=Photobacterium atrarenae TaxID=865757 RepID=A0ABY5GP24_9GAMM|nr:co-chaperone GroES [Photobacterium atrarenae]UTV30840.1 co-chaperone GroES [Photobacterium atrarenae]
MKLKPLHDWVVIERDPVQTEEKGLFLPSSPSNQGKVLAVGPKVKDVWVGDEVHFNAYSGLIFVHADWQLTFIKTSDIDYVIE